MGMRIFWFLLALFVPKIINDAMYPVFNNGNTGVSLTRAMLGAIPAAIASVFFLYKAFPEIFSSQRVRCPDCREKILKDARVCKHCGFRISSHSSNQLTSHDNKIDLISPLKEWVKRNEVSFFVFSGLLIFLIISQLFDKYFSDFFLNILRRAAFK